MNQKYHLTHVMENIYGSFEHIERCIFCWGTRPNVLSTPCLKNIILPKVDEAWKEYEGDFNSLTDKQIEDECEKARREVDEAENWLEAVASWERAGKPRTPLHIERRPSNCRNRLRDEGKAYPKSGCASCGTGGLTGCPHEQR